MPPGVKRARSTSLAGEQRDENPPRAPEVQTGFGRETPSFYLSPCRVSPVSRCAPPRRSPPPHSLSHTPERAESISLSLEPGASSRLILRVLYLGEKSMSTDMLTRVQTWRARERGRGKKRGARTVKEGTGRQDTGDGRRAAWKSGYWYAVSDFAVSRQGKGGSRARRETHTSGCTCRT